MKVSTKLTKDSPKVETELTVTFDGTPEQMQTLATRAIVIAWQAIVRDAKKIPATDTIKVSEIFSKVRRTKVPATPQSIAEGLAANPAALAAALARLRELGVKV